MPTVTINGKQYQISQEAMSFAEQRKAEAQAQMDAQSKSQGSGGFLPVLGMAAGLPIAYGFGKKLPEYLGFADAANKTGAAAAGGGASALDAAGSFGAMGALPDSVMSGPISEIFNPAADPGSWAALLEGQSPIGALMEGSTTMGTLIPVAGGLYGGYTLAQNLMDGQKDPLGGAMSGAAIGTAIAPGVGTIVGGLGGALLGSMGGGKGKAQMQRDSFRSGAQKAGLLDSNFNITRADGSTFNMGRDGGARYTGKDGKEVRYGYETDWSNPLTGQTVGLLNPLAEILASGDDTGRNQLASQLSNAAIEGVESQDLANANVRTFYQNAGLDAERARAALENLRAQGGITDSEYAAYMNGVNSIFGAPGQEVPEMRQGGGGGGQAVPVPRPTAASSNTPARAPVVSSPGGAPGLFKGARAPVDTSPVSILADSAESMMDKQGALSPAAIEFAKKSRAMQGRLPVRR